MSIVFKFIPRITLVHAYIRHFVYALSYITAIVGYIRVGPNAWVYDTSHLYPRFPYTRFPSWAILALLTCRFHYQPFPYRVVYTLFPLPAHSRPP